LMAGRRRSLRQPGMALPMCGGLQPAGSGNSRTWKLAVCPCLCIACAEGASTSTRMAPLCLTRVQLAEKAVILRLLLRGVADVARTCWFTTWPHPMLPCAVCCVQYATNASHGQHVTHAWLKHEQHATHPGRRPCNATRSASS
jgi:hypothetical protein